MAAGAQALIFLAAIKKGTWVDSPLVASVLPGQRPLTIGDERDQTLYHVGVLLIGSLGFALALLSRDRTIDRIGKRTGYLALLLNAIGWRCAVYGLILEVALPEISVLFAHLFAAPWVAGGILAVTLSLFVARAVLVILERGSDQPFPWVRTHGISENRDPGFAIPLTYNSRARLWHLLVTVVIAAVFYQPNLRALVGYTLEFDFEPFHHWNFFVMSPGSAYLLGLAPVVDSYSQYGIGVPIILVFLSRLIGDFSYVNVVAVGLALGVPYFIGVYLLIWVWTKSYAWSIAGAVWSIFLQIFSGQDAGWTIWQYPSSTYLRSPLDVALFLILTWHSKSRRWSILAFASCGVGTALFWETDTGVYLALSFLAYCAYRTIDLLWARNLSVRAALPYGLAVLLVPTSVAALLIVTLQGALLDPLFWAHWIEPITIYQAGYGMLPMPDPNPLNLYVFLTPAAYVLAVVLALAAALGLTTRSWPAHGIIGAIGVYGLGIYHQYVGRSHPYNWFHVAVPLVVLLAMFGYLIQTDLIQAAGRRLREVVQSASWILTVAGLLLVANSTLAQAALVKRVADTYYAWTLPRTDFLARDVVGIDQNNDAATVGRIQQLVAQISKLQFCRVSTPSSTFCRIVGRSAALPHCILRL